VLPPGLMVEAAVASKTSENFYQTTQHNSQENRQLFARLHENPKSHSYEFLCFGLNPSSVGGFLKSLNNYNVSKDRAFLSSGIKGQTSLSTYRVQLRFLDPAADVSLYAK
jgi:hypothetical protein